MDNFPGESEAVKTAKLQFGHGGEAVDDLGLLSPLAAALPLQFGHGGDAVDDDRIWHDEDEQGEASIRPRR